jgi:hypothetical protein
MFRGLSVCSIVLAVVTAFAQTPPSKAEFGDISGEWRKITGKANGLRLVDHYEIRLDGEHLYIEPTNLTPQQQSIYSSKCDLTKEADGYKGACAEWAILWGGPGREASVCNRTLGIEITKYTPLRVEGRKEAVGVGHRWTPKDYSNCGQDLKVQWVNFTFVRPQ